MGKPVRFTKTTRTWCYAGQSKQHTVTSYTARYREDAEEAARRNEDVADEIQEYADACDSGTARVLQFHIEEVA